MAKKKVLIDLRGTPCPLNWARAKAALSDMRRGQILEIRVDDPKARDDIPRAAEMEGHHLVELRESGESWRIVLEK
ncbi:MAG: sulfurtransferase TusA family protein [Candidatus Binatia bacterium]